MQRWDTVIWQAQLLLFGGVRSKQKQPLYHKMAGVGLVVSSKPPNVLFNTWERACRFVQTEASLAEAKGGG